jgi:hypothetical protein
MLFAKETVRKYTKITIAVAAGDWDYVYLFSSL